MLRATRALHELTILHRGELSGILAGKASQDKHLKEFVAEPLTKVREYEKPVRTKKEQMQQRRVEGTMDMAEREYFGPRRIAAKSACGGGETGHKTGGIPGGPSADRDSARAAGKDSAPSADRGNAPSTGRDSARAAGYGDVSGAGREASGTGGNQSVPVCIRDDPGEYQSARPGARKGKSCGPVGKKEQILCRDGEHVRADADYAGRSDIIRVSFVKGVTEKIGSYGWWAKAEEAIFMERQGTQKQLLRLRRVRYGAGR